MAEMVQIPINIHRDTLSKSIFYAEHLVKVIVLAGGEHELLSIFRNDIKEMKKTLDLLDELINRQ